MYIHSNGMSFRTNKWNKLPESEQWHASCQWESPEDRENAFHLTSLLSQMKAS